MQDLVNILGFVLRAVEAANGFSAGNMRAWLCVFEHL
jgi:hypothetical protein